MKILVAGFGNVLQQDDGFGVQLLKHLQQDPLIPPGVQFLEAGIGGISLVQELLTPFDAVIILDALEGDSPGEIKVLEVDPESADPSFAVSRDTFADVHYVEPGRALALASAIGALPAKAFIVGCVARSTELGDGLSTEASAAIPKAAQSVRALLARITHEA